MAVIGKVDKHSGVPAYLQIMNMIKSEIILGRLRVGDKLPPVRVLQKVFDVNVNTVVRALEKLVAEGVLESRHGVGYFVRESSDLEGDVLEIVKECVERLKERNIDRITAQLLIEEVWRE